ncbi:MAG: allantoinase AllB, partial [Solirubrobacteraceae bacterium]|nr:allantoinase AllB [Solirubrobacteraceae bacterium]
TTVVDMPLNCIPATTTPEAVQGKRDACPTPAVDVGMWGGAVAGGLAGLPELLRTGVHGAKAFMIDSGVDWFDALETDDGLRDAMRACATEGVPLLVHAEDAAEAAAAPFPTAVRYLDLVRSRPPSCEVRAIERLAALAQETGAHVHIVHVTAAEAVEALASAQAAGIHITGETCPHYLHFAAEDIPDADPRFKCFPPIRDRSHQDALWAGLHAGTLSLIVSDHSPAPWAIKDTGNLATGWGGIGSIQVSFPATWTSARERGIPLERVVGWMATAPAAMAGLASKGRIEVGLDADLVAFAPDASFTVRGTELLHRHPQTPYDERRLFGVVRETWLRGRRVDPSTPHGGWLMRDTSVAEPPAAAVPSIDAPASPSFTAASQSGVPAS